LHRRQRAAGALGGLRQQLLGRADLDHHDADRVGDDVVQLPRDPGPLGRHRRMNPGLLLGLEPRRAPLQLGGAQPALAQRPAQQPRTPEHDGYVHEIAGTSPARVAGVV